MALPVTAVPLEAVGLGTLGSLLAAAGAAPVRGGGCIYPNCWRYDPMIQASRCKKTGGCPGKSAAVPAGPVSAGAGGPALPGTGCARPAGTLLIRT